MTVQKSEVIERLKAGETLINVIDRRGETVTPIRHLSSGGTVHIKTYQHLTQSEPPFLKVRSPGLFEGSEPQEWEWDHERALDED